MGQVFARENYIDFIGQMIRPSFAGTCHDAKACTCKRPGPCTHMYDVYITSRGAELIDGIHPPKVVVSEEELTEWLDTVNILDWRMY